MPGGSPQWTDDAGVIWGSGLRKTVTPDDGKAYARGCPKVRKSVVKHYADKVDRYCQQVLNEDMPVGRFTIAAVKRWYSDLEDGEGRGLYFDQELAARMVHKFPTLLRHSTGSYAGAPFELYSPQLFWMWQLWGWRRKNKTRRFRDCLLQIARGNGKSPLSAGCLVIGTAYDEPQELRAESYVIATKFKQSQITTRESIRQVSSNDEICYDWDRLVASMRFTETGASIEPLACSAKSLDGLIPHFVAVDELHAWKEEHREALEKVDTALGKREQPLRLITTTAGTEASDVWLEVYEYSKRVVMGEVLDDAHLSLLYEIDEDDDPLDPDVWEKANPLLPYGVIKLDYLKREAEKARVSAPALQKFTRFHCNRASQTVIRPINETLWALGDKPLPDLDRPAAAALDWGWRDDLASLAYCWVVDHKEGKNHYAIDVDVFIPAKCQRDLSREPWSGWIKDGYLTATPGNTTDWDAIYHAINSRKARHGIRKIAFDKYNAGEFGMRMANDYQIETFEFYQRHASYHEPCREFLQALGEGRLVHGGNPLLGWCALNLLLSEDVRGYVMPDRANSKEKIDPICASIMAVCLAMFEKPSESSVYERRALYFEVD